MRHLCPSPILDRSGRPIGYSLDLCAAIVGEIGRQVDQDDLAIAYVKVTAADRIAFVVDGRIDLECGSTTANAERSRSVAFSPTIFVAGTRLMVGAASGFGTIRDLAGRRVVVTKGTTNERAIHAVDTKLGLGLTVLTAEDHEQSFEMLADGRADAFATDDILLAGLIAKHKAKDRFRIVGDLLSYDPYGVMFRKDEPELKAAVERAFRDLATQRDLMPLYDKWFVARLPTGERLGIPASPQLEDSFKALDDGQAGGN